jgi:hypothetical protein
MIRHNTKHPVLQGCVNLCTFSQTVNGPVPSMGPHPHDYTGGHMHGDVSTLRPPYPITGQSYTFNAAISKMRNTATPHYSKVRVRTTPYSQLQNTETSHYSAVRIHTKSGSHTPTPHYGSARARTPSGSLVYHRLFPHSGLTYTHCNTH